MVRLHIVETHPEIAADWDYQNNPKGPECYSRGSDHKVYWICQECHGSHIQAIKDKVKVGNHTCRQCGSRRGAKIRIATQITMRGSLSSLYPKIAKEWHPTKNGNLTPNDVTPSSNKAVYWLGICGHTWIAPVYNRTGRYSSGCGICWPCRKLTENEAATKDKISGLQRLAPYIGNDDLTLYLCPKCHQEFNTRPHDVWAGKIQQCDNCRLNQFGGANKFTEEQATVRDKEVGFVRLDPYIDAITKRRYICPICKSVFLTKPESVWKQNTTSCGCISSRGELKIKQILTSMGIEYTQEQAMPNCVGKSNRPYLFDFYIPSLNMCIEYHGKQHFDGLGWNMTIAEFQSLQERDKAKRIYCQTNEVKLLEIPYTDFNNIATIIRDAIQT